MIILKKNENNINKIFFYFHKISKFRNTNFFIMHNIRKAKLKSNKNKHVIFFSIYSKKIVFIKFFLLKKQCLKLKML